MGTSGASKPSICSPAACWVFGGGAATEGQAGGNISVREKGGYSPERLQLESHVLVCVCV